MKNTLFIEELLSENHDVLLRKIGEEIQPPSFGIAPLDPKQYIQDGKEWLLNNKTKFENLICKNPQIETLLNNNSADRRIELVVIIADILSANYTGIPVFTISVILVKEGVHVLCK